MPKTREVSHSEIDALRQCPFKWELAYGEGWEPPTIGLALQKGKLWHAVLETHYTVLKETKPLEPIQPDTMAPDEVEDHPTGEHLMAMILPWIRTKGQQGEIQSLVEWMYRGHLAQWGTDPHWKIVAVEQEGAIYLPTERGGRSPFKLRFKADLLVEQDRKLWLVDHKSGRNLPNDKELDLADQFGLYTWALNQLGYHVFGQLHNAARTQRNKDDSLKGQPLDTRFKRTRLVRTKTEQHTIAVEAYQSLARWLQGSKGQLPRHPDADTCQWKCPFTDPCLYGRKGDDTRAFLLHAGFTKKPESRFDYYNDPEPPSEPF